MLPRVNSDHASSTSGSATLAASPPKPATVLRGVRVARRVTALDPRGMGDSDRPVSGYEMRTVAGEHHGFVEALRLNWRIGPVDIVGHDHGTWIGDTYAAEWPGDVKVGSACSRRAAARTITADGSGRKHRVTRFGLAPEANVKT